MPPACVRAQRHRLEAVRELGTGEGATRLPSPSHVSPKTSVNACWSSLVRKGVPHFQCVSIRSVGAATQSSVPCASVAGASCPLVTLSLTLVTLRTETVITMTSRSCPVICGQKGGGSEGYSTGRQRLLAWQLCLLNAVRHPALLHEPWQQGTGRLSKAQEATTGLAREGHLLRWEPPMKKDTGGCKGGRSSRKLSAQATS